MRIDADVLVIGAGPAGAASAILLARAGWRVVVIEKNRYPRHKVCGECISATNLAILDDLGVGAEVQRLASPEIRRVGWMCASHMVIADMPACAEGPYRYGRALGRNQLDTLLLERARAAGAIVLQPAKAVTIVGAPGRFECQYELLNTSPANHSDVARRTLVARVVIDAHGSWERGPTFSGAKCVTSRPRHANSDLLAFKATFKNTSLPSGLLPVFAFNGGYGGIVVADEGRATIACCIRRDALRKCRERQPGVTAGSSIETHLRSSFRDIGQVLENARLDGRWLSAGPIRPGISREGSHAALLVGNALGETHPLIGEGIGMALQSAVLLVHCLTRKSAAGFNEGHAAEVKGTYTAAWNREFRPRLRLAALYAHSAMTPGLSNVVGAILSHAPKVLTVSARLAGKARHALPRTWIEEVI